jgi:hypothetical protein
LSNIQLKIVNQKIERKKHIVMLTKVVISPTNSDKAVAFFTELRAKKAEAMVKIEDRTKKYAEKLKSSRFGDK